MSVRIVDPKNGVVLETTPETAATLGWPEAEEKPAPVKRATRKSSAAK